MNKVTYIDQDAAMAKDILDRYSESQSLRDYLAALEILLGKQHSLVEAADYLKTYPIKTWFLKDIDHFQNLVARLNFRHFPQQSIQSRDTVESEPEASPEWQGSDQPSNRMAEKQFEKDIEQIAAQFKYLEIYQQALLQDQSKYFFFTPAFEIEEALRRDFKDSDDPGIKIGGYLRAAFSRPGGTLPKVGVAAIEVTPEMAPVATNLFISLVAAVSEAAQIKYPTSVTHATKVMSDGVLSALMFLMKGLPPVTQEAGRDVEENEPSSAGYWLVRALANCFDLTQDLFDCVLKHLFQKGDYSVNAASAFFMLCQLPFEKAYQSLEEYEKGTHPGIGAMIGDGDKDGWKERYYDLPVMRWGRFSDIDEGLSSSDACDDDVRAAIGVARYFLSEKFREYRCQSGGYSPLSVENAALLCGRVRFKGYVVKDSMLALAGAYDIDFLPGVNDALGCTWLCRDTPTASSGDLKRRADLYLPIVESAFSEGLEEYASALLGFFVYSQSMFADNGLNADLGKLSTLISRGLQGPGKSILAKCLEHAVAQLERCKCILEAMMIDAYLKPRMSLAATNSSPDKIIPIPTERVLIREGLRSKMPLVFERFARESFELLVDAELMWSKMHGEFGSGMDNWGTVGHAFAKPIESELVARLKAIYDSNSYRAFYKSKSTHDAPPKATLGVLIYMLKAFERLPDGLKESIKQAGVACPIDPKLLRELDKIMQLRNQGAHPQPFTAEDFLKLRTILFDGGGFTQLAESLTATTK